MENKVLILRALAISYKQQYLGTDNGTFTETVKNALSLVTVNDTGLGIDDEKNKIEGLVQLTEDVLSASEECPFTYDSLINTARVLCGQDDILIDSIEDELRLPEDRTQIKKSILRDAKALNDEYNTSRLVDIVGKASYQLRMKKNEITDLGDFTEELLEELTTIKSVGDEEDPAVVAEVNFSDEEDVTEIFKEILDREEGASIQRFGWKELNTALQGGARRGDFIFINALQHNYKTGTTISMFKHMAMHNVPVLNDPTKKPLHLRISFEDSILNNMQSLYINIRYNETMEVVDVSKVSPEEMSKYVIEKMTSKGFEIAMMRVNVTDWSYRDIFDTVLRYETEGFELATLILDYLPQVPTKSCNQTGAGGTDLRDLFRKVRAFCSSKDITCITPGQLNPASRTMLTNGVTDREFLETIKGRGMYAGSSQLGQENDIGILIHIVPHGEDNYLHMVVEKHRLPVTISESKKSFFLQMPNNGMPIPDNLDNPNSKIIRKLPPLNYNDNDDSGGFSF